MGSLDAVNNKALLRQSIGRRRKKKGNKRGPNIETPFTKTIVDLLRLLGCVADRVNCGEIETAHGSWVKLFPKGTPDVHASVRPFGRNLWIETKVGKGKVRKAQLARHAELRAVGDIVVTVTDQMRDWDERVRAAVKEASELPVAA